MIVRIGEEVREALALGLPVVALESTIVAHGLPRPDNLRVAREIEQTVRENGAIPATIGMIEGGLTIGLDDGEITRLATTDGVAKLSVRDLGIAAARGVDGATTVASTSAVAAAAGIRVFATGGLGGVHREAFDESADLATLARTRLIVVCAGVKSILDIGATLERLETLGVGVVGYGTDRFPGFFISDGGFDLDWRLDSPEEVALAFKAQAAQGISASALIVANPLPADQQLDPELHDRVLAEGMSIVERERVTGKRVTPVLLGHFHSATQGASLAVNVRIILRNAALAARIAAAL